MSYLAKVLFFWENLERSIVLILLKSYQSKIFDISGEVKYVRLLYYPSVLLSKIRSSTDLPSFECNFCSLTYPTSKQLCNHKRIHKTFNAPVAKENLQEPVVQSASAQTNLEDDMSLK
ncbi:hypothetical protein J3Q64DRAFT_1704317 [Phycomyces blakesleeanus]|uniref:C2H2-type domain-containing protein n=1 Tax=Phycomyces blakesleeanus TaxID=4837 RepID=A0ABR3AJ58_PHYBL